MHAVLLYVLGMITGAILMLIMAVLCVFREGYIQYRNIGYSRRIAFKLAYNYTIS